MATVYTPLLYHSNYGVGGSRFKLLFEYLKTYHIKSCGIADETLFGLPEFIHYAKIYNIQPIVGARVLLPAAHKRTTLYLFVKNQQGYRNLCQILTKQAFAKLDLAFIKEHATGLVLLSHSIELLRALQSTFKDLYYLVLPYHTVLRNEFPPLAAQKIFYVTRKEKILHKLMCAIKDKTYECMAGTPHHLLTDKEFNKLFTDYPEAIMNNQKLANLCTFVPENKGWIFPQSKQRLDEII
ncbi:MAG: PHP domain-containing protein, partial [candidate division WOR-3 bacterium]